MMGHHLPFSEEENMDQLEPRAKAMDNQCAGHMKKRTYWRRVRQKEKIQGVNLEGAKVQRMSCIK